jgi:hypothetical protein
VVHEVFSDGIRCGGLHLPANVQSLPTRETPMAVAVARRADIAAKERINAWTVGLAGELIEGAPLRLAAEIARVVNEKDKLHVIPIVTRGATRKCQLAAISQGC